MLERRPGEQDRDLARSIVRQKAEGGALDAVGCEREPIHIPGTIQPHGALLAFDRATMKLAACSANAERFFSASPASLLSRPASEIFPHFLAGFLSNAAGEGNLPDSNPIRVSLELEQGGKADAWIHERNGMVFAELERAADDRGPPAPQVNTIDRRLLQLRRIGTLDDLQRAFVRMIREMTGFERVLLYAFDDQWSGLTVAEDKADDWHQSFLGLYFPASDIPAQARALYAENLIRFMPERDYAPVPLLAADPDSPPLDLTGTRLRSLSPVHREYQRNIGVAGSMSASVLKDGALWGLLVGHHRQPHYIPAPLATDILILTSAFSIRLSEMEKDATARRRQSQQAVYGKLLQQMSAADNFVEALTTGGTALLELFDASGAAVVHGGVMRQVGQTPSQPALSGLLAWVREQSPHRVYVTDNLAGRNAALAAACGEVSGLLAVPLETDGDVIVWFRPEIAETITWAGNPAKAVQSGDQSEPVLPRRSFEAWIEQKRGFAQPWSDWDVEVAASFGDATENVIVRHLRQIRDLNEKLHRIEQLNAEQNVIQQALNTALAERSAALQQREMLMREVDHRVKNSLQLISSVLRLQGYRIEDPDARHHFTEASRRVMTVAQVHQRLYQTERVQTVEFAEYLRGLCRDLAASLSVDPSLMVVDAEETDVQTDHVIPLGLIVNELVTNAFKYAYAGRTPGPVSVSFKSDGKKGFKLMVADKGAGLPAGFDPHGSSGLGMKLITTLTAKLGATLQTELKGSGGAQFTIDLPDITVVAGS